VAAGHLLVIRRLRPCLRWSTTRRRRWRRRRLSPESWAGVWPSRRATVSSHPDDDYFSDGLAEELINLLVHVPNLNVTARTSSFAFRGKEQDIRRIAEALGVGTILEGSVRRAGSRIRVTAQFINVEDGYHLWSERALRPGLCQFSLHEGVAGEPVLGQAGADDEPAGIGLTLPGASPSTILRYAAGGSQA